MKKILAVTAILSFSAGYVLENSLNKDRCLVQNISLDKTLSVVGSSDCSIMNVKFIASDWGLK